MAESEQVPEPHDPVLVELRRALSRPVGAILSGLKTIDTTTLPPEHARVMARITEAARELDGTVSEVDHVLAVLAGQYLAGIDTGDPGAIVRAVVAERTEAARALALDLAVAVDPDVPRSVGLDGATLGRVAAGLVDHAMRHVTDGTVTIAVRHERPDEQGPGRGRHGGVHLLVTWTGEPRAGTTHGLGLALATRQATLAGGRTGVPLGRGEGAWVRLPFLADPAELPDEEREARPLRVLVVEDDRFSAMMAELQVELAGHVPLAARDRDEVFAALTSDAPPDLVLMDRNLGGTDGREITRQIRAADARWSTTPVVGLSASVLEDDRADGLASGMDDYLVKPLSSARLEQVVAGLIEHGRVRDRRADGGTTSRGARPAPPPSRHVTAIRDHLTALADELGDPGVVTEICERFLQELPDRLGQLAVAALQRDKEAFRTSAHRFRGAAAAVGGDVLIEAIDAAKEVTDVTDLPRVSEAIRQAAMKVRLGLKAWLDDQP